MTLVASLAAIVVFFATGVDHVRHPFHLSHALQQQGFGSFLAHMVARIQGLAEVSVVGLFMVASMVRPLLPFTLGLALLLALALALYILVLLVRGYEGSCGCLSSSDRLVSTTLLRPLLLAILLATALATNGSVPAVSEGDAIMAALAGAGLGLTLLVLPQPWEVVATFQDAAETSHRLIHSARTST